ncbi:MAG: hypothetical protein KDA86_01125 [Planctomycetaceae bacterium]|nr:hypothetical protein [Planctomycetaceae bacterium]
MPTAVGRDGGCVFNTHRRPAKPALHLAVFANVTPPRAVSRTEQPQVDDVSLTGMPDDSNPVRLFTY